MLASAQGAVQPNEKHVAVVGAGPSGLIAAETLAEAGHRVVVYERMPRAGRKLLLAGRGGLNLTHSESLDRFMERYRHAAPRLRRAIDAFPPERLRAWCEGLGQETFIGTSGRVFPRTMKTSPLLRAWLARLAGLGVEIRTRHRWLGWDGAQMAFETPGGKTLVEPSCTLLALGGASWPRLGSDGTWEPVLRDADIKVAPLAPANCGLRIAWSEIFRARFAGLPLKRIALTFGGETSRCEALVTAEGLEGGAVYALSAPIRDALQNNARAEMTVDLRPDLSVEDIATKLAKPRGKQSLATHLRKAMNLDPVAIGLLQEEAHASGKPLGASSPDALARIIKALPFTVTGMAPIERAISTAGGVIFDDLDDAFMLRARPGTFVAGEMLDWEAPTGGYLLQACFATGHAAAQGVLAYLAKP
jgi:uncharacterized flavoprotein (TIGR03862 family)